jgi:CheY-like chemotaxis protein
VFYASSGGAMHNQSIPICYFPSTVLFIDDSQDFLLNFVLQLDERLAYRVFDSPLIALDFVKKKRCELDLLSQRCISEYTEAKNCPTTNHTVNVDLAAIHAEVYNPQRFSDVSVVVVDYAMPGMNGLEFCKRLENSNIKKILLTGQADEKLAIEAFNAGLIDRFVQKSDPRAADIITDSIYELQRNYFQDMSEMIVRMLSVSCPSCLEDKAFVTFFQQLLEEKNICEYYLADHSGSFILLDEDAKISYLMLRTESDMRAAYDMAMDSGASDTILDSLANGEKIPFFWQSDVNPPVGEQWDSRLIACQSFGDKRKYFYSWVDQMHVIDIQQSNISPYHHYLEELDAEELLMVG